MIKLVNDTIDEQDIASLIEWLRTFPRLTKGELTEKIEKKWSQWIGVKHSLYVNSGSSANLAIVSALQASGRLKNDKIVVPSVSWSTTVAPVMQMGLTPILCECDKISLGLDITNLTEICRRDDPAAIVLVHVLGIPCQMDEITELCKKNNILLIEDSCESVGSIYKGTKTGAFGIASSFSFYFGHHISTIEGGMVCTNDDDLYEILKSVRCHGWDRDLRDDFRTNLRSRYGIDDFRGLYTFYWPGFNLRSTDLQAQIGLSQLEKLETICKKRYENLLIYDSLIQNDFWKLRIPENVYISNFAYPIITPNIDHLINALKENDIESRPLICGSIGRQPFWKEAYGEQPFPFADIVHDYGLYVPNNHQITEEEIKKICRVVNRALEDVH